MNKHYIEYDQTGRIVCIFNGTDEVFKANPDKNFIEGIADPEVDYVKNGRLSTRPLMKAERELNVLKNLPVPCQIIINEATYDCDEPTVELEFDQPGIYNIIVRAWPYIDKEFVYENQAQ